MSIREEFEKEKNDWDNTCVGCTGGSDKCYKNWLEAKLQQERQAKQELLEGLRKIAQHGKEAEKVCEMGFTTFEIANKLIKVISKTNEPVYVSDALDIVHAFCDKIIQQEKEMFAGLKAIKEALDDGCISDAQLIVNAIIRNMEE
jgi:hypothetical protein